MAKKKPKQSSGTIALNKRAKHDFHIETKFEAGIALTGWEVKSMRAGKCQLVDTHVFLKNGEAFLLGARIEPLNTASTHVVADPMRYRKLLLHKRELAKIHQAVNQKGHTCIATAIYWKKHLVKLEICLAKGKKDHDKRATLKEQQGKVEVGRAMRERNK